MSVDAGTPGPDMQGHADKAFELTHLAGYAEGILLTGRGTTPVAVSGYLRENPGGSWDVWELDPGREPVRSTWPAHRVAQVVWGKHPEHLLIPNRDEGTPAVQVVVNAPDREGVRVSGDGFDPDPQLLPYELRPMVDAVEEGGLLPHLAKGLSAFTGLPSHEVLLLELQRLFRLYVQGGH